MLYIPLRLTELHSDFVDRVSLEEMQAQSLTLVFRHIRESKPEPLPPEVSLHRLVIERRGRDHPVRRIYLRIGTAVKVPRTQIPASCKSALVGHKHNQFARRSLGAIEDGCLSVDAEKHFLHHVFGLADVFKKFLADTPTQHV